MISVKNFKKIKDYKFVGQGPKRNKGGWGLGGTQSIFLPLLREMSGFCAGLGRERTNLPIP